MNVALKMLWLITFKTNSKWLSQVERFLCQVTDDTPVGQIDPHAHETVSRVFIQNDCMPFQGYLMIVFLLNIAHLICFVIGFEKTFHQTTKHPGKKTKQKIQVF